ncbi:hypothetical protein [Mycoplasmopsis edwardii]|nr:hypothetical protein [Mycoplasmopsis edwardii]
MKKFLKLIIVSGLTLVSPMIAISCLNTKHEEVKQEKPEDDHEDIITPIEFDQNESKIINLVAELNKEKDQNASDNQSLREALQMINDLRENNKDINEYNLSIENKIKDLEDKIQFYKNFNSLNLKERKWFDLLFDTYRKENKDVSEETIYKIQKDVIAKIMNERSKYHSTTDEDYERSIDIAIRTINEQLENKNTDTDVETAKNEFLQILAESLRNKYPDMTEEDVEEAKRKIMNMIMMSFNFDESKLTDQQKVLIYRAMKNAISFFVH